MGCDGGTIPRRDELVKQKQKPEQVDKEVEKAAKWKYCASSQEELVKPIVACQLGKLYNKEIILNYLLSKTPIPNAPHIKSLKHIKELKLTLNPKYLSDKSPTELDVGGSSSNSLFADIKMSTKGVETNFTSQFICPILGLDMNGAYKFCYLLKCGCTMSHKALKEMKVSNCPSCNMAYNQDDVVILNGDEAEVDDLSTRMKQRLSAISAKVTPQKLKNLSNDTHRDNSTTVLKRKSGPETNEAFNTPSQSKLVNNAAQSSTLSALQSVSIVQAAVKESTKKLKKEDIFGSVAYKSIFKPSSAVSQ